MSWWIPDYDISDHEVAIESLFRKVKSGNPTRPEVERTVLICFTNRSGSNFLGAALASTTSTKPARELLNHPVVRRRSERLGITSFDEYLQQLMAEFGHRGIFIVKSGLRQLYYLAKLDFLDQVLPHPEFILIERNDVIAQAVSWSKAIQTGQWTSSQSMRDTDLVYDFDAIHSRVDTILRENSDFKAFLARNDCLTHFVRYEDLRAAPAAEIESLAQALRLPDTHFRPDRIQIERQHSDINANWKARYLREVREQ